MGALAGLKNVASTLINQFGTTATLTHTSDSAYNATTRVVTPTERAETVKGVKMRQGQRFQKFSLNLVTGAEFGFMVKSDLRYVPVPQKATVTISDVAHSVLHVEPIDIGDDGVAAYILHCKR